MRLVFTASLLVLATRAQVGGGRGSGDHDCFLEKSQKMVDDRWSVVPITFPSGTSRYPRTSIDHGAVLIATWRASHGPRERGLASRIRQEKPWEDDGKNWQNTLPTRVPPPPPSPPVHTSPPHPPSKTPFMQAWPDLFGGLGQVGFA